MNVKSESDLRTARRRQAAAVFAWGLHHNGSTAEASKLMQSVVSNGEISPEIAYYAARIFQDNNRKELAKQIVTKAFESDASFAFRGEAEALPKQLKAEE